MADSRVLVAEGTAVSDDPFNLSRFLSAQDEGQTYQRALAELSRGRKVTHWMWFVFPQLAGLGRSATARHFAVRSLAEARAYLGHPVLGARLIESTHTVLSQGTSTADDIFGTVDAVKLRSCLTLFVRADPSQATFRKALDAFFDGLPDPATEALLNDET